jgi:hypothetical protein
LREIQRRRSYGRLFTKKIQEMGEKLARMREVEVAKRENFLKEFGLHLPRDFIPALSEKPSHCDIRMRPFDVVGFICVFTFSKYLVFPLREIYIQVFIKNTRTQVFLYNQSCDLYA